MSSAAWIDESMRQRPDRAGVYVLAAAVIRTDDVESVRFEAARLAPTRRGRVHYREADDDERRKMIQAVSSMTAAMHVVVVGAGMDNARQERARRLCMEQLLWQVGQGGVRQVYIEARTESLNAKDRQAITYLKDRRIIPGGIKADFRRPHGPQGDPLLWLPDIVAGAVSSAHGSETQAHLLVPLKPLLRVDEIPLR
ncbi:hypothetical protein ACGFI9_21730 [Micromonospora sp. NPDC048930]|uniref:hypothetical protein n=1 Tax=Micromonospora sp. NPDC048930 TaxID=3364261 RepID=UPI00371C2B6A